MTFEPASLANKAAMGGAEMSFNQKSGALANAGAYGTAKVDSSFHTRSHDLGGSANSFAAKSGDRDSVNAAAVDGDDML